MANMTPRDREQLATWLRSKATLDEVLSASRYGTLGAPLWTPAARRAFEILWTWSAARFGGTYGDRQTKAFLALGPRGLNRRIARAKALAERLSRES